MFRSRFMKSFRKLLVTIIGICLILLLMTGVINQVRTGQKITDWIVGIGRNIGHFIESIFDGDGPIKVTEDGVYFQDVDVPDSNNDDSNSEGEESDGVDEGTEEENNQTE